jgi:hypothetical protein
MDTRPRLLVASLVLAAAAALPSSDARACGGCFHEASTTQTTVVTGHRMAFAISPTHSVLWDQIQYSGSPGDFAWVLPVKGGAVLELSNDAWFETLDAATSAQIVAPRLNCPVNYGPVDDYGYGNSGNSRGCCGSSATDFYGTGGSSGGGGSTSHSAPPPPPVTVTHEGTVGPYETVTLHANVPNALPNWLTSHNYAIDPTVAPIIDAYTQEGFDFIALRLQPGQGVQQMKPVRVVTPGMSPSLPLRMVAAGTGANVDITLFVIGEGRWEAQNFPNAEVDPGSITWDFTAQGSDYGTQRQNLLIANGGRTWNNAFANQGSLLSQDTSGGVPTFITVGNQGYPTLAQAYAQQGVLDGEAMPADLSGCLDGFGSDATSPVQVFDCSNGTGMDGGTDGGVDGGTGVPCSALPVGDLPSTAFACGPLDDIAVALVGLHPRDVWLTRLEAALPRSALATDLTLQASSQQTPVSNVFNVIKSKNSTCGGAVASVHNGGGRTPWLRNRLAVFAAVLTAVAAAMARRRRPAVALAG